MDYVPGYDEHRRISNITNSVSNPSWSGRTLSDNDYTYDKVGNRLHVTPDAAANYAAPGQDMQKDINYTYDDLHRLTKGTYNTDGSPEPFEQFDYDLLGNREQFTQRDTTVLNYDHSLANEYTGIGTSIPPPSNNILHDAAGNLTSDENAYGYVYDFENRLVRIFDDSTTTNGVQDAGEATLADFSYDALGRRIAADYTNSPAGFPHRYYYDGQNVVATYLVRTSDILLERYFIHGTQYIDERAILHDVINDAEYYYFNRELYSVEGLVNNRGHEVERYSYDAYGKPVITAVHVADLNYDGIVGSIDLASHLAASGFSPCDEAAPIQDLNGDGLVDSVDLAIILGAWEVPVLVTLLESGLDNPYAFTGRRMDFFGYDSRGNPQHMLYHYRAREYDPMHGRFMQRDPLGGMSADPLIDEAELESAISEVSRLLTEFPFLSDESLYGKIVRLPEENELTPSQERVLLAGFRSGSFATFWMTRHEQQAGANLHEYTSNNPATYVDSWGLCKKSITFKGHGLFEGLPGRRAKDKKKIEKGKTAKPICMTNGIRSYDELWGKDVAKRCNELCCGATLYLVGCGVGHNESYMKTLAGACQGKIKRVCGYKGLVKFIPGTNITITLPWRWNCIDVGK